MDNPLSGHSQPARALDAIEPSGLPVGDGLIFGQHNKSAAPRIPAQAVAILSEAQRASFASIQAAFAGPPRLKPQPRDAERVADHKQPEPASADGKREVPTPDASKRVDRKGGDDFDDVVVKVGTAFRAASSRNLLPISVRAEIGHQLTELRKSNLKAWASTKTWETPARFDKSIRALSGHLRDLEADDKAVDAKALDALGQSLIDAPSTVQVESGGPPLDPTASGLLKQAHEDFVGALEKLETMSRAYKLQADVEPAEGVKASFETAAQAADAALTRLALATEQFITSCKQTDLRHPAESAALGLENAARLFMQVFRLRGDSQAQQKYAHHVRAVAAALKHATTQHVVAPPAEDIPPLSLWNLKHRLSDLAARPRLARLDVTVLHAEEYLEHQRRLGLRAAATGELTACARHAERIKAVRAHVLTLEAHSKDVGRRLLFAKDLRRAANALHDLISSDAAAPTRPAASKGTGELLSSTFASRANDMDRCLSALRNLSVNSAKADASAPSHAHVRAAATQAMLRMQDTAQHYVEEAQKAGDHERAALGLETLHHAYMLYRQYLATAGLTREANEPSSATRYAREAGRRAEWVRTTAAASARR